MKILSKRFLSLFIFFLLITTATSYGQSRPDVGRFGISATMQSNQTNLSIPIWASENVVIAPTFGFVHEQDSFTTLNVGIKPRFLQDLGDNFASYVGLQGIIRYTSPDVGDELTDLILGANGGGEYFLNNHFSLGVEGQLNFLFRDNNDNRVATGAAITGTYYF